jgi:hypothetical protein
MELDAEQWLTLLGRTLRKQYKKCPEREIIRDLHNAATWAASAPDESGRIRELCVAARKFSKMLRPYVTRRRRDQDTVIKSFRRLSDKPEWQPHPHRNCSPVQIEWRRP